MNSKIAALFVAFLRGSAAVSAHSYDTLPDNDDIAVTCAAAADTLVTYAEIASTVGAVDVWVYGLHLSTPSVATDFKITVATGAAGSETAKITVPFMRTDTTAAGVHLGSIYNVPFPIYVQNGTRLAAAGKSGTTVADTINIVTMHGLGLL